MGGCAVTVRLLVQCDGTRADRPGMSLERCRAMYPTRADVWSPNHRRDTFREAAAHGWNVTSEDGRDLCPACARGAS
jgi:hypothetical protein